MQFLALGLEPMVFVPILRRPRLPGLAPNKFHETLKFDEPFCRSSVNAFGYAFGEDRKLNYLPLVGIAIGISLAMAIAWMIQRATNRSGWIDSIWAFTVGLAGAAAALASYGTFQRRLAIAVLVLIWSVRLGFHIAARMHGKDDDPRYRSLIDGWGSSAGWRLFVFLQIQAVAAVVLTVSVFVAASGSGVFPGRLDMVAIALALLAIGGEALADYQLARFRGTVEARSQICEQGLWRYSRHPNYFFEWLFWCSLPVFALHGPAVIAASAAPILMYWLLVHVSGIPPLEDHMERSRGELFRELKRRVNSFFPGLPKGGAQK
ncbi:DUF1295 domain-containing protein [Rhizobium grahamii]|uniref:Transmembrane protein n=1 Tax=Rhizobium grahamii CCGE 502 TaxID=990285 RepID=S3HC34_9HYPH|nr:transmembrane protein [Rhizobium grahamii CCGE 502]